MKAINLLTRSSESALTPEEEGQLARELADAYCMDEVSATSRDVQRIAEKVRSRMDCYAVQNPDKGGSMTSTQAPGRVRLTWTF